MKILLKIASYLFHPLWMPFVGALLYFLTTPRFFPTPLIKGKLMAIAIMTLFIPIVFHFLLRTLKVVSSPFLEVVGERNWPLLFYCVLLAVTQHFVLNPFDYPELYFYFLAILISTASALILVWVKIKISLHMTGLAGITMFIIILGLNYHLNLVYTVSFFIAVTGLTASSRLHYKAHGSLELVMGYLIGAFPQILILRLWL